MAVTEQDVWQALEEVYDPEIPVSVVDLGLVYSVKVEGDKVQVDMTLTAPGCPMHSYLRQEAQQRLLSVPGVKAAEVNIVWDPPWNPNMIKAEGRKRLGWGG
jgi:metal-sulfur cluster biosynthetic enzyme